MVDPISMSSGVFYDRAAIVAWFKTKEPLEQIPCPKTNLPIDRHELAVHTNVVMRYLIDDFVKSKEDVARQFNASVSPIPSSNHARFFANADDQASSHARFFADADDQNLSRDAGDSGNYKTSSSPLWQK
jgi:hypothetical protein